jgi:hypothetical protein
MEFKGTKGKWESVEIENDKGSYWKVYGGETSICNIITRNMNSAQANALLISKAPEMLETLIELRTGFEGWDRLPPYIQEKIHYLIKEATQL